MSDLSFLKSLPCFLHGLNNIIGKICAHPWMKQIVTQATIVTFFNNSLLWPDVT